MRLGVSVGGKDFSVRIEQLVFDLERLILLCHTVRANVSPMILLLCLFPPGGFYPVESSAKPRRETLTISFCLTSMIIPVAVDKTFVALGRGLVLQ